MVLTGANWPLPRVDLCWGPRCVHRVAARPQQPPLVMLWSVMHHWTSCETGFAVCGRRVCLRLTLTQSHSKNYKCNSTLPHPVHAAYEAFPRNQASNRYAVALLILAVILNRSTPRHIRGWVHQQQCGSNVLRRQLGRRCQWRSGEQETRKT